MPGGTRFDVTRRTVALGLHAWVQRCGRGTTNGAGFSADLSEEDQTVDEDQAGGRSAREGQPAALTPRPLRLLLIGRVKPGAESALRETQARFPCDAAIEAGIEAVEAYVGSGHYAVELEIGADDVQRVLATFFNDHRVREFRSELEPMVEGLPDPGYQFGPADRFHADSAGTVDGEQPPQRIYNTGDLPFAASMYRWRVGEQPQTGKLPHSRMET
jgi:hypothetical protein